jgi:hypothetical protein
MRSHCCGRCTHERATVPARACPLPHVPSHSRIRNQKRTDLVVIGTDQCGEYPDWRTQAPHHPDTDRDRTSNLDPPTAESLRTLGRLTPLGVPNSGTVRCASGVYRCDQFAQGPLYKRTGATVRSSPAAEFPSLTHRPNQAQSILNTRSFSRWARRGCSPQHHIDTPECPGLAPCDVHYHWIIVPTGPSTAAPRLADVHYGVA